MAKMPSKKFGLKISVDEGRDGEQNNICMKSKNTLLNDVIVPKLDQFGEIVDFSDVESLLPSSEDEGFNIILDSLFKMIADSVKEKDEYHVHLLVDVLTWETEDVVKYIKELWDEEVDKLNGVSRFLEDIDVDEE